MLVDRGDTVSDQLVVDNYRHMLWFFMSANVSESM